MQHYSWGFDSRRLFGKCITQNGVFDRNGQRLYFNNVERKRFIETSKEESMEDNSFINSEKHLNF